MKCCEAYAAALSAFVAGELEEQEPVSYTHLDVYKRQEWTFVLMMSGL